jgi:hypothetical protein
VPSPSADLGSLASRRVRALRNLTMPTRPNAATRKKSVRSRSARWQDLVRTKSVVRSSESWQRAANR